MQSERTKSPGILTISGFLQLGAIFLYISSCALYMITPACHETPHLMAKLFPAIVASSALFSAILCIVSSLSEMGLLRWRHWTLLEPIFNILDFMVVLALAIVIMSQCGHGSQSLVLQRIPSHLAIVAAIMLAISSIIWFVRHRSSIEKDLETKRRINAAKAHPSRKSILV